VIDKLSSALQQSVKDETVRKRFADLGAETMPPERATPRRCASTSRPRSTSGGR